MMHCETVIGNSTLSVAGICVAKAVDPMTHCEISPYLIPPQFAIVAKAVAPMMHCERKYRRRLLRDASVAKAVNPMTHCEEPDWGLFHEKKEPKVRT